MLTAPTSNFQYFSTLMHQKFILHSCNNLAQLTYSSFPCGVSGTQTPSRTQFLHALGSQSPLRKSVNGKQKRDILTVFTWRTYKLLPLTFWFLSHDPQMQEGSVNVVLAGWHLSRVCSLYGRGNMNLGGQLANSTTDI